MNARRLLRTSSFRLTLRYALITGISFLLMFGIMIWSATHYMKEQIDASVAAELREIDIATEGTSTGSLVPVITASTRSDNGFHYLLLTSDGEKVAGDLPVLTHASGIVEALSVPASGQRPAMTLRGIGRRTDDGGQLFVGTSSHQIEELQEFVTRSFLLGLVASMVLVLVGGAVMSAASLRRVEEMSQSSRDIVNGDLGRRIALNGSGDEFDHLAASLNAMLDRITALMRGLEQVSVDVAHDLRTPLSRLRQKLELVHGRQASAEQLEHTVDAALVDIDAILATFSALLRIAQIEGGKRRANFAAIDLAEVIDTVAEIYQPAIEDRGQTLTLLAAAPVRIAGDRELLTQMVANLVENATRHSPPGATIILEAMHRGERACLVVADTGPGIPHDAHAAVLTRFYRLDVSRSTPGNGLGLSLVKAVAELHGATMELGDNHPGLRVTLDFPPTPSQR